MDRYRKLRPGVMMAAGYISEFAVAQSGPAYTPQARELRRACRLREATVRRRASGLARPHYCSVRGCRALPHSTLNADPPHTHCLTISTRTGFASPGTVYIPRTFSLSFEFLLSARDRVELVLALGVAHAHTDASAQAGDGSPC